MKSISLPFLLWLGAIVTITSTATPIAVRSLSPGHSLAPRAAMMMAQFQPGALVMSTIIGENLFKRYGIVVSVRKVNSVESAATSSAESAATSSAGADHAGLSGAFVYLYAKDKNPAVDRYFSVHPTHGFFLGLSLVEPPIKPGDRVELVGSAHPPGKVEDVKLMAEGICQVSIEMDDGMQLTIEGRRDQFKILTTPQPGGTSAPSKQMAR